MQENLDLYSSLIRVHFPHCTCVTETDGKRGIELALTAKPSIAIIDAKLPGLSGYEVVQALRNQPETASMPLLMISGVMTQAEHRIAGLEGGADAYLCKPFQAEEFVAEVKVLLRVRENEDRLRLQEMVLTRELALRSEKLRESEARFEMLIANSPDAIFVEAEDGRILDVNEAACHLHGLSRETLLQSSVYDLVPPERIESTRANFPRLFTGDLTYIDNATSLRADGSRVPVEIRAQLIDYLGERAVMLIVRDISRRMRLENALRTVAEGVSSSTGFAFFYALTEQLAKVFGVRFAFVGQLDPTNPERIQMVAFTRDGQLQENHSYPITNSPCELVFGRELCHFPDNITRHFPKDPILADLGVESFMGVPLFYSDGRPLGLIAVMDNKPMPASEIDQSLLKIFSSRAAAELERMRAVESLWESEEKYRSLTDDVLDSSLVALFILDASYRIVWTNQAAERYFGIPRARMIGRDKRELVRTEIRHMLEDPASFTVHLLGSYRGREPSQRLECHILPGENREDRWLEHLGQPIQSGLYAGGRIEHYTDITPQKRLREQLLQSQKMEGIGRLAGGIAHDFNNLLTSILGCAHLILDELPERHPIRNLTEEIILSGKRAEKLTRQLLVFGKKQLTQIRPLNVNEIVTEAEHLLRRTLGEDIRFTTQLHPQPLVVAADQGQLEQVLMNLSLNARDAMPKGGNLTISTSQQTFDESIAQTNPSAKPGIYAALSITDTGTGMSSEVRARAFEPFYTTKKSGKGTGLGLSIVYSIVEQFNGFITLESTPNVGTCFTLFVPITQTPLAAADDEKNQPIPRGTETILVVEDEDTVRHLTVRILKSLGYHVLQAHHGSEALAICDNYEHRIDLIFTDVVMPVMGGGELAERIAAEGRAYRMLFTSGFAEDALSEQGVRYVDNRLILKPYTREALARKIRAVLDEP